MMLFRITLVCSLAALLSGTHVHATLDQSNVTSLLAGTSVNVGSDIAQTFKVGLPGILSRVEIALNRSSVVTATLQFDIRLTLLGKPVEANSPVLASKTLLPTDVPLSFTGTFTSVDISSFGISVSPGDVLAIALRSNASGGVVSGQLDRYDVRFTIPGDAYLDGGRFGRDPGFAPSPTWGGGTPAHSDIGFQTFVTAVPEPSSFLFLGLVGTCLICGRYLKKLTREAILNLVWQS